MHYEPELRGGIAVALIRRANSMRQAHSDEGEMAEWSIAAVLKTVELRGSGGSNPSLSAIQNEDESDRARFFCALESLSHAQACMKA